MKESKVLFINMRMFYKHLWLTILLLMLSIAVLGQDEDCYDFTVLPSKDSVILNPVSMCKDDQGTLFYYANIITPVCKDTLCKIVNINVYWDLAGNYLRFDTIPGKPLTKHDHLPFTSEDYQKLHSTLMDDNSILANKQESDLIDESSPRYSEVIDGWTGATLKEIKSSVVDGAPYSTYTLWHLVHGNIRKEIRDHTLSIYNSEIKIQLLKVENPKTLIFGLKKLNDDDYLEYSKEILSIMGAGNPMVNFYISKKLPESFFSNDENKNKLKAMLPGLDKNTQSILGGILD